ncbi:P-loop containing nucleoside triphosphate hydrolase protein [Trichophaea hybrida]|nr:P-loop containing nucleoside triphosphate hydrolase protein [Trichophaea hybrida]
MKNEASLNSHGLCTFPYLWTLFRPGIDVYTKEKHPRAFVVREITMGGSGLDVVGLQMLNYYEIQCWNIIYNGQEFTQAMTSFIVPFFSGKKEILSLEIYPSRFHIDQDGHNLKEELVNRGRKTWDLHINAPSHVEYRGDTFDKPPLIVDSRCVIDAASYHQYDSAFRKDDKSGDDNQRCLQCRAAVVSEVPSSDHVASPRFAKYNRLKAGDTPTDHQLLLLTNRLYGWVLKDRKWASLNVDYVSAIKRDHNVFENLILPPDRTKIIKALVQSHIQKGDEEKKHEPYSADSIKGKGQGLLILLHGPPGVGKTSTAECVAEYTEKPLFPITCGDIGTNPETLEEKLQTSFQLGQKWNAVLLLDEADVFLQQRTLRDLKRNSLVSVFLRILEYYKGILFLTTNRVGEFDEAFTSRIHAIIYYPKLQEKERLAIWENHLKRFKKARRDVDVDIDVTQYIASKELKKLDFNGRQIRNLFQTAVSLALYDASTEGLERPRLEAESLRRVVKLSTDFKDYLEETRGSDKMFARDEMIRRDDIGDKKKSKGKKKKAKAPVSEDEDDTEDENDDDE